MQPDYVMACEGEIAQFKGVGFLSPRFLHSDHHVVVANIGVGRKGQLTNYWRTCQKFSLSLPLGPKDANTTTFDTLAAKCVEPKKKRLPGNDWISKGTWKLIAKRTSLLHSGKIRQAAVRRMKLEVQVALKADKSRLLTTKVGDSIVSDFSKGNVQEVFRHLKGWYRTASETKARPCHQTMEHQTDERVELYVERDASGAEFPANETPFTIADIPPLEGELRTAVSQLSHDRCGVHQGSTRNTSRLGSAGRRRKRFQRMVWFMPAPGNHGVSLWSSAPPFG